MPTENELKYMLKLDCEKKIVESAQTSLKISQGYLVVSRGVSLRTRSVEEGKISFINNRSVFAPKKNCTRHTMTFKSAVNGRVIEIEKRIDDRDFNDLWGQCLNKLIKHRVLITAKESKEIWEIDFFKDHNNETYFAMAEIEMPEGQLKPKVVPNFIKDHLLFEVPLTDSRFSSKLLADVRYAISLKDNLTKG